MKTEYQNSLLNWAKNLSDEKLSEYLNSLEKFSDTELDALFFEDIRRMTIKAD